MDGLKPYLVEIMSETLEMHPHSLIWGSTYKFKIIWFNGNKISSSNYVGVAFKLKCLVTILQ